MTTATAPPANPRTEPPASTPAPVDDAASTPPDRRLGAAPTDSLTVGAGNRPAQTAPGDSQALLLATAAELVAEVDRLCRTRMARDITGAYGLPADTAAEVWAGTLPDQLGAAGRRMLHDSLARAHHDLTRASRRWHTSMRAYLRTALGEPPARVRRRLAGHLAAVHTARPELAGLRECEPRDLDSPRSVFGATQYRQSRRLTQPERAAAVHLLTTYGRWLGLHPLNPQEVAEILNPTGEQTTDLSGPHRRLLIRALRYAQYNTDHLTGTRPTSLVTAQDRPPANLTHDLIRVVIDPR